MIKTLFERLLARYCSNCGRKIEQNEMTYDDGLCKECVDKILRRHRRSYDATGKYGFLTDVGKDEFYGD